MRIVAISGSLRAASSNTALVHAARLVAPEGVEVHVYEGLGTLPHFNPDLDGEGSTPPPTVAELRAEIGRADGLLISSPEYAHGAPGVLKNALDWLVSSVEFPGKPIALVGASTRATYARASLAETLRTMSAQLVDAPEAVPVPHRAATAADIAGDPALAATLRAAIQALVRGARG
ncbi:MAG: NAD(P)H-dependent oxidoreductase [Gemmatirosa sp.]|nr:NAD(P)H-dependent oxidoreductase [Gemmatirosa sp.]